MRLCISIPNFPHTQFLTKESPPYSKTIHIHYTHRIPQCLSLLRTYAHTYVRTYVRTHTRTYAKDTYKKGDKSPTTNYYSKVQ